MENKIELKKKILKIIASMFIIFAVPLLTITIGLIIMNLGIVYLEYLSNLNSVGETQRLTGLTISLFGALISILGGLSLDMKTFYLYKTEE